MRAFSLFICLFVVAHAILAQQTVSIRGRVVDEKGKPVKGAYVAMTDYGPPKDSWEWFIDGVKTDNTGTFTMATAVGVDEYRTFLFVSVTTTEIDSIEPISAPFQILQKKPSFKATPLVLRKDLDSNVGDIPVLVWLNTVEVRFLNKNLQPKFRNFKEASNIIFVIRDLDGNVAAAQDLSIEDREKRFHYDRGSIFMDLPEGTWTIELIKDWNDLDTRKFRGKSEAFHVIRDSSTITVNVVAK